MDGINSMVGCPETKVNCHIYKLFGLQQSGSMENPEKIEEFNEEDIWRIDAETKQVGLQENGCNDVAMCRSMRKEGNNSSNKRSVKAHKKESCVKENNNKRRMSNYQSSAPVNIPDWSKMVWEEKRNENGWNRNHGNFHDNNEDDDLERNILIPPHEFIARQLALNEITLFSVYEGAGRTLKGRDAIWTITGFMD